MVLSSLLQVHSKVDPDSSAVLSQGSYFLMMEPGDLTWESLAPGVGKFVVDFKTDFFYCLMGSKPGIRKSYSGKTERQYNVLQNENT